MEDNVPDPVSLPPDVSECAGKSLDGRDGVEYDEGTNSYHTSFDSTADSVTLAVVSAVAIVNETDPLELPQLHAVVDTEALESLVHPASRRSADTDVHVTFTYHGYTVTVRGCGIVSVQPPVIDRES